MIYLCRHGQTEFNRERRFQGQSESILTPLGKRQAAAMGDLLHRLVAHETPGTWRIIASPLIRARTTAEAIGARLGLDVEFDDRLMEISVGEWEGHLWEDMAKIHPDVFASPEWSFAAPGGETYEDVMGRVSHWLMEQPPEPGRRLIVVSHGVAGRLLRGAYAGLTRQATLEQDMPQDAIHRLSKGQIERLNCEALDEI